MLPLNCQDSNCYMYAGEGDSVVWCGSGVVSVSLSRTIIDYMGLSRILQDTAMAYQTNILKSLLTVFFHNRQGSAVSFHATLYACKRAGQKYIDGRRLLAYP